MVKLSEVVVGSLFAAAVVVLATESWNVREREDVQAAINNLVNPVYTSNSVISTRQRLLVTSTTFASSL